MKINFPLKNRGGCKGVLLYNFDNLDSAALFTIYIVQKLTSEVIIIIIIIITTTTTFVYWDKYSKSKKVALLLLGFYLSIIT